MITDQSINGEQFIRETIVQISQGVVDAQKLVKESGVIINPATSPRNENITGENDKFGCQIKTIDFDISVEADKKTGDKVGVFVALATAGFGAKSEKETNISRLHRIQFSIPITFPRGN